MSSDFLWAWEQEYCRVFDLSSPHRSISLYKDSRCLVGCFSPRHLLGAAVNDVLRQTQSTFRPFLLFHQFRQFYYFYSLGKSYQRIMCKGASHISQEPRRSTLPHRRQQELSTTTSSCRVVYQSLAVQCLPRISKP